MSATKKEKSSDSIEVLEQQEVKEKTCFVIMPISDHPDYDDGHFKRVYDHIISPACKKAGYKPVIATDSKASNLIMFNILKNIVECDMAICDLSTKNANVFYELGLRQAFNKKTILITDGKEREPFDITGFRYVKYSPSLRIDTVERNVNDIADMLKETELADENDINSITSLLRIHPASIDKTKDIELSKENTVIFSMLSTINEKLNKSVIYENDVYDTQKTLAFVEKYERENLYIYEYFNRVDKQKLGRLKKIGEGMIEFDEQIYLGNLPEFKNEIYVLK
ncbi:hypothetical protein [Providencia rettgeri]|uniref:hypothetical protein n=1 Tax=Providencia rettgeri TaxID=587 RepID=UPI001BA57F2E|nr:hypothetical protein [Providencia rettgeri]MBS0873913.1 hypothetical protein [Providencia rettgeri]MBS0920964.1 hypothetical protein [Providencia rettgeri]